MSIELMIAVSVAVAAVIWALKRDRDCIRLHAKCDRLEQGVEYKVQLEERMEHVFKNLSTEVLDRSGEKLHESGDRMLQKLIDPLKQNIADFRKRAEDMYDKEGRDRASLKAYIDSMQRGLDSMTTQTDNLTKALKGDSNVRGNWGELTLERILEASGLRKDTDYKIQPTLKDDNNANKRPDVVVYLPQKRAVVIDAKVSLVDWMRYMKAQNAEPEVQGAELEVQDAEHGGGNQPNVKQLLKEHVKAIRKQFTELSQKNYDELTEGRYLEMVLMFVPLEPAFLAAMGHELQLYKQALGKRVAIVSQTTLMAVLHLIDRLWKADEQSRNVQKIAKQAADIYDKAVGFQKSMDSIGEHLDAAKDRWSEGNDRLSEGQGSLLRRTEQLCAMGVSPKKRLKGVSANMGASDEEPELSGEISHEDSEREGLGEKHE